MNSTLPARNCTASIRAAIRGPFGSQLMLGKMKYAQSPVSVRILRTGASSFFRADRAHDAAPCQFDHRVMAGLIIAMATLGDRALPKRLIQIPDDQPDSFGHVLAPISMGARLRVATAAMAASSSIADSRNGAPGTFQPSRGEAKNA